MADTSPDAHRANPETLSSNIATPTEPLDSPQLHHTFAAMTTLHDENTAFLNITVQFKLPDGLIDYIAAELPLDNVIDQQGNMVMDYMTNIGSAVMSTVRESIHCNTADRSILRQIVDSHDFLMEVLVTQNGSQTFRALHTQLDLKKYIQRQHATFDFSNNTDKCTNLYIRFPPDIVVGTHLLHSDSGNPKGSLSRSVSPVNEPQMHSKMSPPAFQQMHPSARSTTNSFESTTIPPQTNFIVEEQQQSLYPNKNYRPVTFIATAADPITPNFNYSKRQLKKSTASTFRSCGPNYQATKMPIPPSHKTPRSLPAFQATQHQSFHATSNYYNVLTPPAPNVDNTNTSYNLVEELDEFVNLNIDTPDVYRSHTFSDDEEQGDDDGITEEDFDSSSDGPLFVNRLTAGQNQTEEPEPLHDTPEADYPNFNAEYFDQSASTITALFCGSDVNTTDQLSVLWHVHKLHQPYILIVAGEEHKAHYRGYLVLPSHCEQKYTSILTYFTPSIPNTIISVGAIPTQYKNITSSETRQNYRGRSSCALFYQHDDVQIHLKLHRDSEYRLFWTEPLILPNAQQKLARVPLNLAETIFQMAATTKESSQQRMD